MFSCTKEHVPPLDEDMFHESFANIGRFLQICKTFSVFLKKNVFICPKVYE